MMDKFFAYSKVFLPCAFTFGHYFFPSVYSVLAVLSSWRAVTVFRFLGQRIVAILPYIKQEIPIMIVFRALGFVADRSLRVLF